MKMSNDEVMGLLDDAQDELTTIIDNMRDIREQRPEYSTLLRPVVTRAIQAKGLVEIAIKLNDTAREQQREGDSE